jgi:hypothetical protein
MLIVHLVDVSQGGFIRQELYALLKDEKEVHFTFGNTQRDGIRKKMKACSLQKFFLNITGDTPSSNQLFDAISSCCFHFMHMFLMIIWLACTHPQYGEKQGMPLLLCSFLGRGSNIFQSCFYYGLNRIKDREKLMVKDMCKLSVPVIIPGREFQAPFLIKP